MNIIIGIARPDMNYTNMNKIYKPRAILARENIRAEQSIRKEKRRKIKKNISMALSTVLSEDISMHIATFVPIPLPISQSSIDEITKVYKL